MLDPVGRRTDSRECWVRTAGGFLPAIAQDIDIDGALSAVANAQVFLVIHVVRPEAWSLRLGDHHSVWQQAEDHVRRRGVGYQYRLAEGARQTAVDHDTSFFVDLVGDRFVDDVEVSAGVHDPQRDTAELVAKLAHATSQRFLAVGFDICRYHHTGVGADSCAQCGG
ncbi:hypothetical protein 3S13_2 [uncultured Caudovirales phage]|uniref:Uncharacterized protein n=1 Tax=uncultured Caudovirales phage TaxID=2100421 RepID=A0A2H4JDA7_9CAUD|nr:hypothetical protein 3S13_2 [uncultured Caudovirales phage]